MATVSTCLLLATACGGSSNAGGPAATAGCAPEPCGAANGIAVTVTNLDIWYQYTETMGPFSGPKFVWHIKNSTGNTLTLDSDGVQAFDANHTNISHGSNSESFTDDPGELTNGCPPRATTRIPPHQTVTPSGSVCVGVRSKTKAAVLEFSITSSAGGGDAVIDVPLPSSYGGKGDSCPSNQVIADAISDPTAQVTNAFCKGDYLALSATSVNGNGKYVLARDDPIGSPNWHLVNIDPCGQGGNYPAIIVEHLAC